MVAYFIAQETMLQETTNSSGYRLITAARCLLHRKLN